MKDAAAIFNNHANDPEVTRYLLWRPHPTIETTREFLRTARDGWKNGTRISWVIFRKDDLRLVGMVGLELRDHRAALGYVLGRAHWGQGFATEAARAVIDWALEQPEIYRVWAVCDVENLASARVLEKAGLQCEGTLRRWTVHPNIGGEPRDSLCYAKVK